MDRLWRGRVETERDSLGESTRGSRASGVVGVAGHLVVVYAGFNGYVRSQMML